jgi:hypothetical protein
MLDKELLILSKIFIFDKDLKETLQYNFNINFI